MDVLRLKSRFALMIQIGHRTHSPSQRTHVPSQRNMFLVTGHMFKAKGSTGVTNGIHQCASQQELQRQSAVFYPWMLLLM